MEQVIMNLALQYGKGKITQAALAKAYEAMGIEQEEDYTGGGIYGIKNKFSPKNLMKSAGRKFLSNATNKAFTGGGSGITGALPLFGGALALGYATNPLREGSFNYNPNLQNQLNYAQGQGYINSNKYTGDSVLSGQNAISGFGTNDYLGQLNKNLNRLESYKNPNNKTFEMIEKTKKQIGDFELAEVKKELATETTTNNGGGGGGFDTSKSGGEGAFGSYDGSKGRKDYNDGGITNVNINRGKPGEVLSKLGELLYG